MVGDGVNDGPALAVARLGRPSARAPALPYWLAAHEATTPRLDRLVAGAVDRGWAAAAVEQPVPSAPSAALPMEINPATGP